MTHLAPNFRDKFRVMDRQALESHQLTKLNGILLSCWSSSKFWREKLVGIAAPLRSLDEWSRVPFTTKEELLDAVEAEPMALLTESLEAYRRVHRTSGTRGRSLFVYDTAKDWDWWTETWQYTLDAANVRAGDRAALAFTFGPFIGFWSAHDALVQRGAMVIPSGGMSSQARLELFLHLRPTILLATPTYALRLAEVAQELGVDVRAFPPRCIVVAGEPGGSIPSVRARIESAWHARVIDHAGASEIGPWGVGSDDGTYLEIIESEFLAEFLPLEQDRALGSPRPAELVLTTLGRHGFPALRYRTGDIVLAEDVELSNRAERATRDGFTRLRGGILGRADEMLVVRGMNIFPSSIESVLREFPGIGEFRIHIRRRGTLDEVHVCVEDGLPDVSSMEARLQRTLGIRIAVETLPRGSLERFESKARRVIDERVSR